MVSDCGEDISRRESGSLRDVQFLAGHSSLQTTQRYIEGDAEVRVKICGSGLNSNQAPPLFRSLYNPSALRTLRQHIPRSDKHCVFSAKLFLPWSKRDCS